MRPRALSLAVALTLAVAACTPSASPSPSASAEPCAKRPPAARRGELRQVRLLLGFRPDVQFAPFYLAQQDGYFERAGLEVTIEHADAGELIRLVADGQAEFGVADATDVMIARTRRHPDQATSRPSISIFPVAVIGPVGAVPSDPADLAGMTIGTPGRFGSSWHALLALLDAGGLTPDDVTIREYPQFNQVEGLLERRRRPHHGLPQQRTAAPGGRGHGHGAPDGRRGRAAAGAGSDRRRRAAGHRRRARVLLRRRRGARPAGDRAQSPRSAFRRPSRRSPRIAEDEATAMAVLEATIPIWLGAGARNRRRVINEAVWQSGHADHARSRVHRRVGPDGGHDRAGPRPRSDQLAADQEYEAGHRRGRPR